MINPHSDFYPAVIGFIIASAITYVVYEWYSSPGVDFIERTVATDTVRAGDLAMVTWRETHEHGCKGTVYRRLISADNSIIEFEPVGSPSTPIDDNFTGAFSFKVPVGLKSGPLIFRATVEFRCNWVQRLLGGHKEELPDVIFNYINTEAVSQ